ncbi:uncharacterized protein FIBRA_02095 [Fibroporia radiculosa]|uniref:RNase H type-1 domain-containing protein n=1 Tax=Fibroporia radiculosa TaxID=599839 RepID=J4G1C6_9APHY|nr:uncharacterized protein FIBRA_02095 [Fibroporia radiculosa]CCM00068.1 predicted protein [Fibroporia radiculosa]
MHNLIAPFPFQREGGRKGRRKTITPSHVIDRLGRRSSEDFAPLHLIAEPGRRIRDKFPDRITEHFLKPGSHPAKGSAEFEEWFQTTWVPIFRQVVRDENSCYLFTDGSLLPDGSRSGCAWLTMSGHNYLNSGKFGAGRCTIFDAEMMALARGIHSALHDAPQNCTHLVLCVDNAGALSKILNCEMGPSQLVSILAAEKVMKFLQRSEQHHISLLWVPSHKDVPPNEFVDELAKSALEYEQPEFVSQARAMADCLTRAKIKWAKYYSSYKYRGRNMWILKNHNPLSHLSTRAYPMRYLGKNNQGMARAARVLSNHFPCGSYREEYHIPGPHNCPCSGTLDDRDHTLFDCPMWIRPKQGIVQNYAPDNLRQAQVRRQRGWTEDDVLIFLRLNPMVATFEWAEILAQAATDREEGDHYSIANALLYSHTVMRKSVFAAFCARINMDPADVHPDSKDYVFFVKEFNADVTASRLIEAWRTQAPAYPPPAFIADTQMADYLVLEQASPTDVRPSQTVSPLSLFESEGNDSG